MPFDGGMMTPMDGSVPDEDAAVMTPDGGDIDASTSDASVDDGGTFDAGDEEPSVAACSCETTLNDEGRIHVCTGSFDRATCRSFSCEFGTPRSGRCTPARAVLCCTMPGRRLYSHLYDDCDHPNCEAGFRAQCREFAGNVTEGACDAPDLPDDEETEVNTSLCAVGAPGAGNGHAPAWLLLLGLAGAGLRSRRKARSN